MLRVLLLGDRATDEYMLPMLPEGGYSVGKSGPDTVKHDWQKRDRWCRFVQRGGVDMAKSMIEDYGLSVVDTTTDSAPPITAFAMLGVCEPVKDHPDRFEFKRQRATDDLSQFDLRVEILNGYERSREPVGSLTIPDTSLQDIAVVAVNDAGNEIRNGDFVSEATLGQAFGVGKEAILKMHMPLAEGQVWEAFSAREPKGTVLIHAEDLRMSGVKILRGLSWDAIVEDLHAAVMEPTGKLRQLIDGAKRVVVFFPDEGAAIIEASESTQPPNVAMVFERARIEGETARQKPGTLVGAFNSFFSRLIVELARGTTFLDAVGWSLKNAVKFQAGFASAERKSENWFIKYPKHAPIDHEDGHGFIIRSETDRLQTELLDGIASPLNDTARDIVLKGIKAALKQHDVPHGMFGKLTTISRQEIEGLRGIRQLFNAYHDDPSLSKPISIAVFGPPGSGKSFGVKQLVDEKVTPILEFNLSEASEADLPSFFHLIRDETLKGKTPLCFFDEFDSNGLVLLKSFLAPMQDGTFRDGHSVHPTGRGIFVFAGGTAETYKSFARGQDNGEFGKKAKLLKKPDFLSRLSGYLDVKGPNQRRVEAVDENASKGSKKVYRRVPDVSDSAFILRRAILLRVMLQQAYPSSVNAVDELSIQDELLDYLLFGVERYLHGARSIESTLRMMSANKETLAPGLSDLSSEAQSMLHTLSSAQNDGSTS